MRTSVSTGHHRCPLQPLFRHPFSRPRRLSAPGTAAHRTSATTGYPCRAGGRVAGYRARTPAARNHRRRAPARPAASRRTGSWAAVPWAAGGEAVDCMASACCAAGAVSMAVVTGADAFLVLVTLQPAEKHSHGSIRPPHFSFAAGRCLVCVAGFALRTKLNDKANRHW